MEQQEPPLLTTKDTWEAIGPTEAANDWNIRALVYKDSLMAGRVCAYARAERDTWPEERPFGCHREPSIQAFHCPLSSDWQGSDLSNLPP